MGEVFDTRPNHYACEGCSDWDEVNGCWKNYTSWCGKDPYEEKEMKKEEENQYDK